MKPKSFSSEFELFEGKILVKIPAELAQKHNITTQTTYRLVSEGPKKIAIMTE